jgi:hypothetical protein
MRFSVALVARLCLALVALHATPAQAQAPASPPAVPDEATEAARAHFKTGMKLYQDQNFAGALAEFEAAYERKPGPGSLQNIALCQKALFRYGEAADSLTLLLARHDAELSGAERSGAKRARDELLALVGGIRFVVTPPTAEVTVDGRPVGGADRSGRLRLNVGEHTLTATAPGYSRVSSTVKVRAGEADATVELTLTPTAGFIDVRSPDPEASIAIDGKAIAFGHVLATVTPNEEHVVQIYKHGLAPFETRVAVDLGKTAMITGQPAAAVATPTPATPGTTAPPPPSATGADIAKRAVGWYGAGSFTLLVTDAQPFKVDLSNAQKGAWAIGAHAGYRLRPAVAVDGLLEYGAHRVKNACDELETELAGSVCGDEDAVSVSYLIRSVRFGPTLELMTTDPRFRALGGIGFGGVWHELRYGTHRGSGVDPYLLLELGIGANTKHVLFTLALQTLIDGTRGMIEGRNVGPGDATHEQAFSRSGRALAYLGLNLRVGYSQWSP